MTIAEALMLLWWANEGGVLAAEVQGIVASLSWRRYYDLRALLDVPEEGWLCDWAEQSQHVCRRDIKRAMSELERA